MCKVGKKSGGLQGVMEGTVVGLSWGKVVQGSEEGEVT